MRLSDHHFMVRESLNPLGDPAWDLLMVVRHLLCGNTMTSATKRRIEAAKKRKANQAQLLWRIFNLSNDRSQIRITMDWLCTRINKNGGYTVEPPMNTSMRQLAARLLNVPIPKRRKK